MMFPGSMVRRLARDLARLAWFAVLVGLAWLVLQVYTPAELQAAAMRFWHWWAGLFPGSFGAYWNPVGAGIVLLVVVVSFLKLVLPRGRGGRGQHGDGYDGGGDGDGGD